MQYICALYYMYLCLLYPNAVFLFTQTVEFARSYYSCDSIEGVSFENEQANRYVCTYINYFISTYTGMHMFMNYLVHTGNAVL